MKGIGRVVLKANNLPSSSATWTTSFSSGAGRGRGVPFPAPKIIGKPPDEKPEDDFLQTPIPAGRGRGAALFPQPNTASRHNRGGGEAKDFSVAQPQTPLKSWQPELDFGPVAGRGRGKKLMPPPTEEKDAKPDVNPLPATEEAEQQNRPYERSVVKPPTAPEQVEQKDGLYNRSTEATVNPIFMRRAAEPSKPSESYGRGRPGRQTGSVESPPVGEENRHARAPRRAMPGMPRQAPRRPGTLPSTVQKLTGEDAVKQALDILKKRAEETGITAGPGDGRGRGRGVTRGRGSRGRGLQRRGGDRNAGGIDADGVFMGDDADGERFVKKIGEDKWKEIEEAINNVSTDILPDPLEDAYIDALNTNLSLEFEPEYYMENFGTNPDIDEKPPIPLRDYLVEMKPVFVAAEGIQSEKEWELFLEDTMKRAPYLRELLHGYAGYGRLTAREEQEHLKNLTSYIPDNAHQSVKNFADRAALSLQSNPGWGFEKKHLCMRKLVEDVNQHYKQKHS
ncbi:hypothetical protein KI387_036047, partial [Taxus chinensis]